MLIDQKEFTLKNYFAHLEEDVNKRVKEEEERREKANEAKL
jgi:hypothetical protein